MKRALGCGNVRRLRRVFDQDTWCLVFFGTLIEGRQLYLPGLWPNQKPKGVYLKRTPFHSSAIPLSLLGLTVANGQTGPDSDNEGADSSESTPA